MFKIYDKDRHIDMIEKKNRERIMKYLKTLKPTGFFFGIFQSLLSRAGIADILGVYDGRFFAFEVKSKTGKPSALQKNFLKMVTMAGGVCGIVRCVADTKTLLQISEYRCDIDTFISIYSEFLKPKDIIIQVNKWYEKDNTKIITARLVANKLQ